MPRPLGLTDLTPARLAGVHLVRAYDPARPSFEALYPVTRLPGPDDTVVGIDVVIDATRVAELEEAIRRVVRAAARRGA